MWHLDDTWARRSDPNVVLVHYDDLCADLAGEMRGLAALLGIAVPERAWPALAEAATLRSMRAGAEAGDRLHGPPGVLKSRAAFFRRGSPGPAGNC